jgi:hypothetical protein
MGDCGDIIRHLPTVFFSFKDHPLAVPDERLRAKITAIRDAGGFQAIYCPDPALIASSNRHHLTPKQHSYPTQNNKRMSRGGLSSSIHKTFRGSFTSPKEPPQHSTTPEKTLKGLLNKLTTANFERVYPKIVNCIPVLQVVFVIKCLLETSAKQQSTFSNVFVMAIKSLSNNYSEVREYLDQYVHDFCASKWYLISETAKKENYDEFCNRLKMKSNILGTVKTILALAEMSLITIDTDLLLQSIPSSNLHDVEIFIDAVILLVQSKSVASTKIIDQLRPSLEKWEQEFRDDGGMRIVFKAQDLLVHGFPSSKEYKKN